MRFFIFIRGLFFGAMVGAAAGLLMAPTSGEALQARLRARYNEVIDEGRRAAADRRAELERQFAAAKQVH